MRSIVGRYLEHSRIYRFGADPATADWFIGCADLMPRNLDRRVEALAPVIDPRLRERLDEILAHRARPTPSSRGSSTPTARGRASRNGHGVNAQSRAVRSAPSPAPSGRDRTGAERTAREHEFKFLVPDDFEMPGFDDLCAAPADTVVEQTATYYDTTDLRLARAGAVAAVPRRRRLDGEARPTDCQSGNGAALVRSRVRVRRPSRGAARPRPSSSSRRSSAPRGSRRPRACAPCAVAPSCAPARRRRHAHRRRLHDRRRPRRRPLPRDRVRARTTTRRPRPCTTSSARLRDAGAADGEPLPKVVRALGPTATAPGRRRVVLGGQAGHRRRRHPPRDLRRRRQARSPTTPSCGSARTPKACTRRASRRAGCGRTCAPSARCSSPSGRESLRDELGWLGDELGAVRDADVLLDRLEDRVAELEHDDDRSRPRRCCSGSSADREAARAVLLDGLRSDRYLQLLDRLVDAAQRPRVVMLVGIDHEDMLREPGARAVEAPAQRGRRPARSRTRRRAARGAHPREAGAVRRRGRGARVRETGAQTSPRPSPRCRTCSASTRTPWSRPRGCGRTRSRSVIPRAVFVAGELGAMERAAADESRAAWPKVWKQASAKRLRDWL